LLSFVTCDNSIADFAEKPLQHDYIEQCYQRDTHRITGNLTRQLKQRGYYAKATDVVKKNRAFAVCERENKKAAFVDYTAYT
jgi:hypothetical protein